MLSVISGEQFESIEVTINEKGGEGALKNITG